MKPFRYVNKGELATIGRAAAVANFGKLRFSGYPAWLLWLFVHLMYLVDFENRLLVFVQWAWNYVTWNRGARLIAHGWSPVTRESVGCEDVRTRGRENVST
jgi:NADH dehydrogenase